MRYKEESKANTRTAFLHVGCSVGSGTLCATLAAVAMETAEHRPSVHPRPQLRGEAVRISLQVMTSFPWSRVPLPKTCACPFLVL